VDETISGDTMAGEELIPVSLMSLVAASVTMTVRVARFAACVLELVVIPDDTPMVQTVLGDNVAPAVVKVMCAAEVPVPAATASNAVEPHPDSVGFDNVPNTNDGRVNLIVSPTFR
jgi:hypothetical protein